MKPEVSRCIDGIDSALAPRAIDEAEVEGIARDAAQDLTEVAGARIVAGQQPVDFRGFEEDEIHENGGGKSGGEAFEPPAHAGGRESKGSQRSTRG
jgi:hypothetical protein